MTALKLAFIALFAVLAFSFNTASAQIGANSKYKNPGWKNGIHCGNVTGRNCARRAAEAQRIRLRGY
jgi:hypothetical protein